MLETTFVETARALTIGSPGQFGAAHLSPALSFFGFGGHYYDPGTRTAAFDRPASVAGIQFAADLVRAQRVQIAPKDEQAAWRAGKVAMIELCSCEQGGPYTDVPFKWQLAALPAGSTRHTPIDVQVGAIVKASKQHDLAWTLLKYLALDDGAAKIASDAFGLIPVRPLPDRGAGQAPWLDAVVVGSTEDTRWMPAFAVVHEMAAAAFGRVIDGAPAADQMTQLQRTAQRAIDDWFDDNKLP
jgi:hypothetical protein